MGSLKNIIFLSILVIIFLTVGCDKIKKCGPQVKPKDGYFGFKCEGEF